MLNTKQPKQHPGVTTEVTDERPLRSSNKALKLQKIPT